VDEQRPREVPGERRLTRPPSERYATAPIDESAGDAGPGRAFALAGLLAVVGAIAITLAGGIFAMTAGLVVIAVAVGWAIGAVLAQGVERSRRRWIAPLLAILGVGIGQLGLWLVARQEGGTLGLVEYLSQVFGFLVPLELAAAGVVAWWQAR
jgi:hypothetical protein